MATTIDDDVVLDELGYGSRGGPGFRTDIIEHGQGAETRNSHWQHPQIEFDLRHAVRKPDAIGDLFRFFRAREGSMRGFRMLDWTDWSTHPNHIGEPDIAIWNHRSVIGAGNGSQTDFQLIKWYRSGGVERARPITRMIDPAMTHFFVAILVNGIFKAIGPDYLVTYSTGMVSFTSAPAKGEQIEAAFTFHVPVAFAVEADTALPINIDSTEAWSLDPMPVVEVSEGAVHGEGHYYGGASSIAVTAAHWQLSFADGRLQVLTPDAAGHTVYLPRVNGDQGGTILRRGGPIMYLSNGSATDTFTLKDFDGNTVVTTVAVLQELELFQKRDGTWIAR